MKKYVWITFDVDNGYKPYIVLKCRNKIVKEIENDRNNNGTLFIPSLRLWEFIANSLHERYPDRFPEWLDHYGEIHAFWYGYNVLEEYNTTYERMTRERMEELKDKFENKDDLRREAEWQVWEILESLPVYVI